MNRNEIIEKLTPICMEVFENDELELSDEMSVGNVEGWTSLTNMMLINEIQKTFGIQFKFRELPNLVSIGAIVSAIETNLNDF